MRRAAVCMVGVAVCVGVVMLAMHGSAQSVAITTPPAYRVFQQHAGKADISIAVTYTGSPTAIEARWNGGEWETIDSSPSGGTYSGTLADRSVGQGTLEVRFANATAVTASRTYVGVGDIYICAGQSNMSGRGNNNQTYTHPSLKSSLYCNNNT